MLIGSPGEKLIAFVSNSAWSVYNFRLDVIRSLKQIGYHVTVIATKDEYAVYLQDEGCSFVHVDFNNRTGNPLKDYLFYLKLRQVYSRLKPAFIFHYVTKPNIYGSLAAATLKIPCVAVITGLGYAFAKENWLNSLVKKLYTKALSAVKEAWFLNVQDAEIFVRGKIVDARKIKILPGEGVNTAWFSRAAGLLQENSNKRPFLFLMSTRLLKSKGVAVFAEALKIVSARGYQVDGRLIGFFESFHPDSLTQDDIEVWQREGLVYEGFANDVRPHLQAADCFVFPSSYNEGIPRGLMEAASMELPVITSDTKGCREVVTDQVTGFLCDPGNVTDLAQKMEKMVNLSPNEREAMGSEGRALVIEKFEVSKIIEVYKAVLKKYLG